MRIAIIDQTSAGTFTSKTLRNTVWSAWYWRFFFNQGRWPAFGVEKISDVILTKAPAGNDWKCFLTDVSDEPGALGYHDDAAYTSSAHSVRGLSASTQLPQMHIFVHTSREDGVSPTEVLVHEIGEAVVDPYVMDDSQIRRYLNKQDHLWRIGEIGDAAQGRGFDIGAPEHRPTKVIEGVVADTCEPAWWGLEHGPTTLAERVGVGTRLEPWTLAPEGYMSVAPEDNPSAWSQVYGSNRPAAEARARAYEGEEKD